MKQSKQLFHSERVVYTTPECQTVEFDTAATICQTSGTGNVTLPVWEDDGLSLDF